MKNIWDELDIKEQKKQKERTAIRLSGNKKIVDKNTFEDNFIPGFCGTCMNYNDQKDQCKFGFNIDEFEYCRLWDNLYTTKTK